MREIQLTKGYIALVDDEDYPLINSFKWCASDNGKGKKYVKTWYKKTRGVWQSAYMHRLILNPLDNLQVDHIDGNGLNNQRCNLRLCAPFENNRNRKPRVGTSQYKGVCWSTIKKKWTAHICANGQSKNLGAFTSEESAAKAYDQNAIRLFGEFAYLNFPQALKDLEG